MNEMVSKTIIYLLVEINIFKVTFAIHYLLDLQDRFNKLNLFSNFLIFT